MPKASCSILVELKQSIINYLFSRYRQSHDYSDVESSYTRVQKMDQYHGQASGIFACDEHLAGKMPSRGQFVGAICEWCF